MNSTQVEQAESICAELLAMHDRSRIRAEQIAIGAIYHRARALADSLANSNELVTT